jgi:Tfp pilus assembly protein PilN
MDLRQAFARLAKADFADAVGVAVGEHVVSAAHVRKRLNAITVQAVGSRPIDVPRDSRSAVVVDFLRDFMADNQIDEARIAFALEEQDVLLGRMQLPATAAENFQAVVRYELDRIFPVPPDSLLTASYWRPLGSAGERVHAVVIASPRERVEKLQHELAGAGLAPSGMTALPVALNDFYQYCRGAELRTAGIFYRDSQRERMTVSSRGMMVADVQYDPEGETRNERLWREVETLVPDAIHDEVEVVVDGEAQEGAVALSAIAPHELFAEGGVVPVLAWHQAAAIGAALGQLGEAKTKLNLLPPELTRAEEGVGLRELGLSALVVVLSVILAATIAVKDLRINNALANEIDSLLPRVSDVQQNEEKNRKLEDKLKALETQRASVLTYLQAMTKDIPTSAYLTTFRYKGDRLEVDGIATNAAELISALERSPYFKDVEFTAPTTKYLQNQERFSLRMGLEQ